ncbi:MAG TPA: NADP oxidoreductase, partial [Trebonia sp.]
VPEQVLTALAESRVKRIHMIGRRGAAHAKFTLKELRELGELLNADILTFPDEVAVEDLTTLSRQIRGNVDVLQSWAARAPQDRPRRLEVRFWLRPVEILGVSHVEGIRLERTRLDGGRVVGTGEYETIPADMVLRSVGYRSVPLPGVPFSEQTMTVPNEAGRVRDREYVAGWLKRGPTGVIGTNKSDAAETVRTLLAEVTPEAARPALDNLLAARGVTPVMYQDWLAIEAAEEKLARTLDRGDKVKLVGRAAMLDALGRIDAGRIGQG